MAAIECFRKLPVAPSRLTMGMSCMTHHWSERHHQAIRSRHVDAQMIAGRVISPLWCISSPWWRSWPWCSSILSCMLSTTGSISAGDCSWLNSGSFLNVCRASLTGECSASGELGEACRFASAISMQLRFKYREFFLSKEPIKWIYHAEWREFLATQYRP